MLPMTRATIIQKPRTCELWEGVVGRTTTVMRGANYIASPRAVNDL